jgi:hypothetical protein
MQSELSKEWAALRERPSPVLINESPAMVKGARRIRTTMRTISVIGNSMELIFFANGQRVRTNHQRQADNLHGYTRKNKNRSRVDWYEKDNRSYDDDPSGEQQEKARKLHGDLSAWGKQRTQAHRQYHIT